MKNNIYAPLENNSYDYIIWGKNHLSLLDAIILQQRTNKRVLLVDDKNIGELAERQLSINLLEKCYLKLLGSELNLDCIFEIENFLSIEEFHLVTEKDYLLFGRSYSETLREFERKQEWRFLSPFFKGFYFGRNENDEQLDEIFYRLALQLAEIFYAHPPVNSTVKKAEHLFPKSIDDLYRFCVRSFSSSPKDQTDSVRWPREILSPLKIFFTGTVSDHFSRKEFYYFFISLFGPRYRINERKLTDSLEQDFLKRGGSICKGNVTSVEVKKGKIESIDVDSFYGRLKAKEFHLWSGNHLPTAPKKYFEKDVFSRLDVEFSASDKFIFNEEKTLLCSSFFTEGPIPLSFLSPLKEKNKMKLSLIYKNKHNIGEQYFWEGVNHKIEDLLRQWPSLESFSFPKEKEITSSQEGWSHFSQRKGKEEGHFAGHFYRPYEAEEFNFGKGGEEKSYKVDNLIHFHPEIPTLWGNFSLLLYYRWVLGREN